MKKYKILSCSILFGLMLVFWGLQNHSAFAKDTKVTTIKIHDKVLHKVDKKIFGHFLEKASWHGETGGDLVLKENGEYREDVYELLQKMDLNIVRYPGGSDIDYYSWTTMIDNVPGSHKKRPNYLTYRSFPFTPVSDNRLGLDEFLTMAEDLDFEPLLVINLGDAYFKRTSITEAANMAAAMVAYCNAESGDSLPEDLKIWPEIRKKNGREKPYDVKYFQIGNETWLFPPRVSRTDSIDAKTVNHYYNCVEAYADAMLKVDDQISIILDGNVVAYVEAGLERMPGKFSHMAFHHYLPWAVRNAINAEGDTLKTISNEALFKAWVATPAIDSTDGQSVFKGPVFNKLRESGVRVAVTEWNWNGWLEGDFKESGLIESKLAQGLGAAGYIHALIRNADIVDMAMQSMLVGQSWGISSIRVPQDPDVPAYMFPTGMVTDFYAKYFGSELIEASVTNNIFYNQPYKINGISANENVAYLDILASQNKDAVNLHVINRHYTDSLSAKIDLSDFQLKAKYEVYTLTGSVENKPVTAHSKQVADIKMQEVEIDSPENLEVYFPPHSITTCKFRVK